MTASFVSGQQVARPPLSLQISSSSTQDPALSVSKPSRTWSYRVTLPPPPHLPSLPPSIPLPCS